MRRLMLLRHAKTETDSSSGRDFDRKLDERGVADAGDMAHWLSQQSALPDRVLVSPAMRTRQTWEIVAKALTPVPEVIEIEELYAANVAQLLGAIHDQADDAATLLLIAHNPGLHELAIGLSEKNASEGMRELQNNFPTSAMAIVDFEIDDWRDAHFQSGRLVDLVLPKILRSAARGQP